MKLGILLLPGTRYNKKAFVVYSGDPSYYLFPRDFQKKCRDTYIRSSPSEIDTMPKIRNQGVGRWGIFSMIDFIFSGKVK